MSPFPEESILHHHFKPIDIKPPLGGWDWCQDTLPVCRDLLRARGFDCAIPGVAGREVGVDS